MSNLRWQQKSKSTQRERMPWRPDTSAPSKQSVLTEKGEEEEEEEMLGVRHGKTLCSHITNGEVGLPTRIMYPSDNRMRERSPRLACLQRVKHKASIVTDLHWCASWLDSLRAATLKMQPKGKWGWTIINNKGTQGDCGRYFCTDAAECPGCACVQRRSRAGWSCCCCCRCRQQEPYG